RSESLLIELSLELDGAEIAESRVATFAVVEALDEFEDRVSCLRRRREATEVDEFGLQRREEALRDGIGPAVRLAAHAADDAGLIERVLVSRRWRANPDRSDEPDRHSAPDGQWPSGARRGRAGDRCARSSRSRPRGARTDRGS